MALIAAACTGLQNPSGSGPSTVARPLTALSPTASSTTSTVAGVAATTTVRLTVAAGARAAPFSTHRTLTVPAGWKAELWARVPDARMEAWSPEGDLLVSEPDEGKIIGLVPGANPQTAPTKRIVLSGLTQPQGLALARLDGRWVLYVGESDQIDRYP
jgi:hypothetical protein